MCMNYKYFLQVKPEYDIKYQKTGVQSQFTYLCEVKDVHSGKIKLNYDKKRFNLIVKECGQCRICRQKRASIKACQAQSEFKTTNKGTFITLTFGNDCIKEYLNSSKRYKNWSYYKKRKYQHYLQWSLEKREFQLFMKRLRKKYLFYEKKQYCLNHNLFDFVYFPDGTEREQVKLPNWCTSFACKPDLVFKPTKIRFLHCGEYGSLKNRPHHHAVILGVDFGFDHSFLRYSWKQKKNVLLHHNNFLSELWPFGEVTVDRVNYQACNYVARYITKKTSNDNKVKKKYDIQNTVLRGRLPEYCTSSNRPGLGFDYFINNAKKIISDEHLYFRNIKGEYKSCPLPQYFKVLMRRYYPLEYRKFRKKSLEQQLEFSSKSTDELYSRMVADSEKVRKLYNYFVGNFEQSNQSFKDINNYNFALKKEIFSDMQELSKIYNACYTDSDFVNQESWRVKCFRNFEKYRKNLYRNALNDYVITKHKKPNKTGLVNKLYWDRFLISTIENPFAIENLDVYMPKREEWLNYERSYTQIYR